MATCRFSLALALLGSLAGCAEGGGARPQTSAETPGTAEVPTFTRTGAPSGDESNDRGAASAKEPAIDAKDDDAAQDGDTKQDEAKDGDAAKEEPAVELPEVEITNIGMHIGGEKNTNAQKQPIRETVKGHYDALRACYAKDDNPDKEITFGVDIRIPREGGQAKITNPRTGFSKREVSECMTAVFEKIEFPPPVTKRAMMVSFSLRFRKR